MQKVLNSSIKDLEKTAHIMQTNMVNSRYDLFTPINNAEIKLRYIITMLEKGGEADE